VKLAILSGDISDRFSAGLYRMFAFMKLKTIHKCTRFLQKRLSLKDLDWLIISKQFCHGYVFLFLGTVSHIFWDSMTLGWLSGAVIFF
jgi:hypothetical protein